MPDPEYRQWRRQNENTEELPFDVECPNCLSIVNTRPLTAGDYPYPYKFILCHCGKFGVEYDPNKHQEFGSYIFF